MSTKPTVGQLPTWDTGLVNTIALTAGHKASGFANSEIPTSGEINTLFAFLYLWCQYLSDGAFQGASSFDNTLGVTGLATLTAGATASANAHFTVSGTGKYKRGTRVRRMPGAAGIVVNPVPSSQTISRFNGSQIQFKAANDRAVYNLILEEGEQLQSITVYVQNFSVSDIMTMLATKDVYAVGVSGVTSTQLGTTQTAAVHTGNVEALTITGLTENVVAGTVTNFYVTVTSGGNANTQYIDSIEYVTTVP
ncbi:MAG: hypothetical protein H0X39_00840 [Actinobacteria bacterium]|nr:hypothetical protein [Actinomycetota bacterium]